MAGNTDRKAKLIAMPPPTQHLTILIFIIVLQKYTIGYLRRQ